MSKAEVFDSRLEYHGQPGTAEYENYMGPMSEGPISGIRDAKTEAEALSHWKELMLPIGKDDMFRILTGEFKPGQEQEPGQEQDWFYVARHRAFKAMEQCWPRLAKQLKSDKLLLVPAE